MFVKNMKITHLKFKKDSQVFLKLWWFSIVSIFILDFFVSITTNLIFGFWDL